MVYSDGTFDSGEARTWACLDDALDGAVSDKVMLCVGAFPGEAPVVVGAVVAWRFGPRWVVDRDALAKDEARLSRAALPDHEWAWPLTARALHADGRGDLWATIAVVAGHQGARLSMPPVSLLTAGRVHRQPVEDSDGRLLAGDWVAEHGQGGTLHQLTTTPSLAEARHLVDEHIDAERQALARQLQEAGEPLSLLAPLVGSAPRHVEIWATAREIEAAEPEQAKLAKRSADQLLTREVASLVGVKPESLRRYVRRGTFPAPDGRIGQIPWWHRATLEAATSRRGERHGSGGQSDA